MTNGHEPCRGGAALRRAGCDRRGPCAPPGPRREPRRRVVLGHAVLALLAALLAGPAAWAASPEVHVAGGDSLTLWVLVRWEEPLPPFVEERLERGIPATVGLRARLVADRSGWFDQRLYEAVREVQVARDPWGEAFLLLDSAGVESFDSVPQLRAKLSRSRLRLPVRAEWCNGRSGYRVEVSAFVLPLSERDAGEVESWLKGQIRGLGRGVLGIPKALFGVVRDLSGLGERESKGKSEPFRMAVLANGRVKALIPGRGGPAEPKEPDESSEPKRPDGPDGPNGPAEPQ